MFDGGVSPDVLDEGASVVFVEKRDIYSCRQSDSGGVSGGLDLGYDGEVVGAAKTGEERGRRSHIEKSPVGLVFKGIVDAVYAGVEIVGQAGESVVGVAVAKTVYVSETVLGGELAPEGTVLV
jgi:hypothetical protein